VTLKAMLDSNKYNAGLSVNWLIFGSGGRKVRPRAGGVLRSYTTCEAKPQSNSKIIANMYYMRDTTHSVHMMLFWNAPTSTPDRSRADPHSCGSLSLAHCARGAWRMRCKALHRLSKQANSLKIRFARLTAAPSLSPPDQSAHAGTTCLQSTWTLVSRGR